jgi:hypothetical protein
LPRVLKARVLKLRNALERLDDADFQDSAALPDAAGRSRSLAALPDARILIGTDANEMLSA